LKKSISKDLYIQGRRDFNIQIPTLAEEQPILYLYAYAGQLQAFVAFRQATPEYPQQFTD